MEGLWKSRWIVALASYYLMISSGGALNTFSLFSQHLKLTLDYNQHDMNSISFFKDIGTCAGIFSGFIYDFVGPQPVLILACILNLVGYLMIWLGSSHRIAHPEVWQMCVYICIAGASAAFTTTAVLVACAKNFPRNQCMILSLMDSTQGLSAAIFTLLYQALFSNNPDTFILVLACFPSLLCLLSLFVIREVSPRGKYNNDTRILHTFLSVVVGLSAYLMLVIILQHFIHTESEANKAMFFVMVIIASFPVVVILRSEFGTAAVVVDNSVLIDNSQAGSQGNSGSQGPERGDDFTILEALLSIDMLLIFIATTCGIGAVLTVTNNLGQIGASLGYSQMGTNTFIALLSIWDFLGGVTCGFVSDILLIKYGIARPFFFSLVMILLSVGNLVMALAVPGALFIGSVLVGLSIGGQWSVLYTMIAELFGLKFYGTLQNITYAAKALGTYVLSVRIAGTLYDREARKEGDGTGLLCYGSHCYRTTFFIMTAACMLACLVSTILSFRTRKFYKTILRKNLTVTNESQDAVLSEPAV